jgi:hypothetical protein
MTLLKVVIVLAWLSLHRLFLVGIPSTERIQFRGMDLKAQAEMIRQTTLRYYVTYIGFITGMGTGVSQLVKQFSQM